MLQHIITVGRKLHEWLEFHEPDGAQHLLARELWDADATCDALREALRLLLKPRFGELLGVRNSFLGRGESRQRVKCGTDALAAARVRATRPRPGAVPVNVASPNGAVSENKAVTAPRQDPVRDSSAELAIHSLAENHGSVIGMREEPARAVAPPASASRPYISATPFDNLQGIEPIAEALIKTLAGKARTGRLDELKALKLLQQAVLL
ncbi:hypothetical protein [Caballeronia sordidicola]|nr:hypothetical protein [Caballeronia sordidicola]